MQGHKRRWFDPWVGKIPWRRKWQPTPIFLPGKFYGQRSLEGYSAWGRKESDTIEHAHTHAQWNQEELGRRGAEDGQWEKQEARGEEVGSRPVHEREEEKEQREWRQD